MVPPYLDQKPVIVEGGRIIRNMQGSSFIRYPDTRMVLLILLGAALILTSIHITLIVTTPAGESDTHTGMPQTGQMYGRPIAGQGNDSSGVMHMGRGEGVHAAGSEEE